MHDLTRLPSSSLPASPSRSDSKTAVATLVRPVVTWFPVSAGLWTGQVGTDYAGIVESDRGRYIATDGRGRRVGEYASREEAQRSLAALVAEGSDRAA